MSFIHILRFQTLLVSSVCMPAAAWCSEDGCGSGPAVSAAVQVDAGDTSSSSLSRVYLDLDIDSDNNDGLLLPYSLLIFNTLALSSMLHILERY
ncbi:hypothetical protein [Allorhodopirellula heiligendammensis]|uniref:Uncharacterized protein n=1 Tax=Allorhodopirellula heiligendammensis TaxID=2714739 RepID=A0A5C6C6H2_9BACT|nr:hypothetical protein [Allorhodopirellula heiligendammensis]TWU19081.1 hypothetical protein Poly21_12520 [Allorhodopirellula heiligendammensis]